MSKFYHGVEVVEIDSGQRSIRTVKSSVIGLIGTAPQSDAEQFPLNTPVLIAGSRIEAAKLGDIGTLPDSIEGIFNQTGAMVVVVRVEHSDDNTTMLANIQGGVDKDTEQRTGIQCCLDSASKLGLTPKILIAPSFTNEVGIVASMLSLAESLKDVIIAESPSTTGFAAIAYQKNFGSARVYVVEPKVKALIKGAETSMLVSPYIAGLIARIDDKFGWHYSPSNHEIY